MRKPLLISALALALVAGSGCAVLAPSAPRQETVYGVTRGNVLVRFEAAQPVRLSLERSVRGLAAGEDIVGLDFRASNGRLYALTGGGRLYTIDPATAAATRVGSTDAGALMQGVEFGMDFDPAGERIRVVGNTNENLRLNPDTAAVIDGDPALPGIQGDRPLAYADGDRNAGRRPTVVALAYAMDATGGSTAYAIDANAGVLATLGGGATRAAPESGRLHTIGALGIKLTGPVQFDISPGASSGLVASVPEGSFASLFAVDLASGRLTRLGYIGDASFPLRAMAIAPRASGQ